MKKKKKKILNPGQLEHSWKKVYSFKLNYFRIRGTVQLCKHKHTVTYKMVSNCQSRKVQVFHESWVLFASSMKIPQLTQDVSNGTRHLCSGSWIVVKRYMLGMQHLSINSNSALYLSIEELWQILYQMNICSVRYKNFEGLWWRGKGEKEFFFPLSYEHDSKTCPAMALVKPVSYLTSTASTQKICHQLTSDFNFSMYIILLLHIYDHFSTASQYINLI